MKTYVIAATALVLMLALPGALYAQGTDPMAVVNAWVEALNAGNIEAALSYLADDAVLTFVPPPTPGDDGIFSGKKEIRGWYEGLVKAKGVTTKGNCQIKGEKVTCLDTYTDTGLQGMGVDSLEMEWAATVRDGKIQGYTATITPGALAKLEAAIKLLPKAGGNTSISLLPLWIGLGGMLILALGLGLRWASGRARNG